MGPNCLPDHQNKWLTERPYWNKPHIADRDNLGKHIEISLAKSVWQPLKEEENDMARAYHNILSKLKFFKDQHYMDGCKRLCAGVAKVQGMMGSWLRSVYWGFYLAYQAG